MKQTSLKKVRVCVSLAFFVVICALFLDLSFTLPEKISDYILYFQFVPSLLKFLAVGTMAASGFMLVTVITLLLGRVYCSFLCPLGVLQDMFAFAGKKLKKTAYQFKNAFPKTRYGILGVVILVFFSGSVAGIIYTDPYSLFGRIFTHVIRPTAVRMNNALVFALEKVNIYAVYPVELVNVSLFSIVFSLTVLALVLWMSLSSGRLYCNTVCPVGTLLGLLSRFSVFKIRINVDDCIQCKACEKVCKAGCMDMTEKSVDFSRCVACYNCLKVCPTSAVAYKSGHKTSDPVVVKDAGKREFIFKVLTLFITVPISRAFAREQIKIYKNSTIPVIRNNPVTPPGSASLKHFTDNCTACHLCIASCPTQVLQPSLLEYGFPGIMQPRMDYKTSYCNYDCVVCSTVCPTGAILPQNPASKNLIQLGKATFIEKNCVVYTQKTDCGACSEHCPTKAVRMVFDNNLGKKAPKIDESICVGCGACEFACPTKPYKSIYVEGNPVHLAAKMPEEEKITQTVNSKEDFPF